MKRIDAELARLAEDFGVIWEDGRCVELDKQSARNELLAMDAAQPLTVTQSNAGIPWYLTNIIDPKAIEIITAPMKATKILSEEKKGDWTTLSWQFPVIEFTGKVATYGDYSNSGEAGVQTNFITRESYFYQSITEWGERELAMAGLAKIGLAAKKDAASMLAMQKFQNKSYFYGVAGLACYGLLNDPDLPASISPLAFVVSATPYYTWADKVAYAGNDAATAIFNDIKALVKQLVLATDGIIDQESSMTLAMSPTASMYLNQNNSFNVNVWTMMKSNFPNLKVETAIEYTTAAGELMQLIADDLEGQDVAFCAFNEKMRAHAVVIEMSSFKQKKSGGTWGSIIEQPLGIQSMLGM